MPKRNQPVKVAVSATTRLRAEEAVIERGLGTFVEVGWALFKIKNEKLYLAAGFTTFTEYCQERWEYGPTYAYDLISAAQISAIVERAGAPPPQRESHARALVELLKPALKKHRDPKAAETAIQAAVKILKTVGPQTKAWEISHEAQKYLNEAKRRLPPPKPRTAPATQPLAAAVHIEPEPESAEFSLAWEECYGSVEQLVEVTVASTTLSDDQRKALWDNFIAPMVVLLSHPTLDHSKVAVVS